MEERNATYNKTTNTIEIDAHAKEFNEKFLQYLLEYKKLPKDAKIIFTRDKLKE